MKAKTKKTILFNFTAMIAVIIATPLLVLNWLDSYTLHGKAIEVPTVCGMSLDEGARRLSEKTLGYEIVDYKYKKGAVENEVVDILTGYSLGGLPESENPILLTLLPAYRVILKNGENYIFDGENGEFIYKY